MVESQEQNASRLSLLQRHREARERLAEVSKLQGQSQAGSEVDGSHGVPLAAPSPTTDAPKSASAAACFSHAQSQEVLAASIAAASSHFHSSPLQTPLAPSSSGASKASLPRKRPLSAFPSRATASPVCQRPASAGVRERVTQAQAGHLKQLALTPILRDPGQDGDASRLSGSMCAGVRPTCFWPLDRGCGGLKAREFKHRVPHRGYVLWVEHGQCWEAKGTKQRRRAKAVPGLD